MRDPLSSPPRIFIAGSTGYTGQALVQLTTLGPISGQSAPEVFAHIRPDSSRLADLAPHFESQGAHVIRTPWDATAIRESLLDLKPTHVFALLGTTAKRGREAKRQGLPEESYESVDYALSALLLAACEALPTPPCFVYLSSQGVSPTSTMPYLRARAKLEAELRASHLPFLIAQPGFISGPDREDSRLGERFAAITSDALLSGLGFLGLSTLQKRYSSLRGDELAAALWFGALNPEVHGKTLNTEQLRGLLAASDG